VHGFGWCEVGSASWVHVWTDLTRIEGRIFFSRVWFHVHCEGTEGYGDGQLASDDRVDLG
jgi:hypothetical protein